MLVEFFGILKVASEASDVQTLIRPFCAISPQLRRFQRSHFLFVFHIVADRFPSRIVTFFPSMKNCMCSLHFNILNQEYFVRKLSIVRLLTCFQLDSHYLFWRRKLRRHTLVSRRWLCCSPPAKPVTATRSFIGLSVGVPSSVLDGMFHFPTSQYLVPRITFFIV